MLKFSLYFFIAFLSLLANFCNNKSEVLVEKDTSEIKADTSKKEKVIGQTINFNLDYVMGKFDPATHPDFIKIPIVHADQEGRFLRKDVFKAFLKMSNEAKKEGHTLIIKSATRNFENQKGIWERKWDGITTLEDNTKASDIADPVARAKKILLYSSMPGTSRHHWGTDIDINAFVNSYFENGQGEKLYKWMVENAHKYGFCQVYNSKNIRPNGYNEEKWHWSYMPISNQLSQIAKEQLKNEYIKGFKGFEAATNIDMLNNYVLSINNDCIQFSQK